jgi:alkanesulfonate monooxygenase SsuD/methylene tetrahydromethanopterin reductase-like flavin-dependent oxidoreductase (luciferase family)
VGGNTTAMARRAGRLGDGWIPWQVTPDEFATRARCAREAYRASGRDGAFSVVAPVDAGRVEDAGALATTLADWRARGATAVHLGFAHDSAAHLIELIERVAGEVMPLVADPPLPRYIC